MIIQFSIVLIDLILINIAFLLSFFIRYKANIPKTSFEPYRESFIFLTLIYMLACVFSGVFKRRFRSFAHLFKSISVGLFSGTLFGVSLIYVFRIKWISFPSSIFVIALPISLLFFMTINSLILKYSGRIKRRVAIIGTEKGSNIVRDTAYVERLQIVNIEDLTRCEDVDEIIICQRIHDENKLNLLIYLLQKLKTNIFFAPDLYRELLSENFNGNGTSRFLATFLGKKTDTEEFLIRTMDITFSLIVLIVTAPVLLLISVLVKLSSPGPILYTQKRAGKDGKVFTLYKFRTMVQDVEKVYSLEPALEKDPRVTSAGRWLRMSRLDELPQLINVLKGQMSLVGPRPENLYRIGTHKALQGLRLAVRPGITGLAQIRSYYDLPPNHKIKYDYLYIQRRSLLLNLYILAKTIPVVLSKQGW